MMNKSGMTSPSAETQSPYLVSWVFHRDGHALTCAVEASDSRPSFDVCIVPHWDLASAAVEEFAGPSSALQRHAEIALQLRKAGWVAQYPGSRVKSAAA
jgi:hypothetical protein